MTTVWLKVRGGEGRVSQLYYQSHSRKWYRNFHTEEEAIAFGTDWAKQSGATEIIVDTRDGSYTVGTEILGPPVVEDSRGPVPKLEEPISEPPTELDDGILEFEITFGEPRDDGRIKVSFTNNTSEEIKVWRNVGGAVKIRKISPNSTLDLLHKVPNEGLIIRSGDQSGDILGEYHSSEKILTTAGDA